MNLLSQPIVLDNRLPNKFSSYQLVKVKPKMKRYQEERALKASKSELVRGDVTPLKLQPELPEQNSPSPLRRPWPPRPDICMLDMDPQPAKDIFFKCPKEWRLMFGKEKPRVYSPPRIPDEEEMPLRKAYCEHLPDMPER